MDYANLASLFRDPPAAYRPMVFWLWNGDITAEGIREAVAEFATRGCGGFFLHPMGESFRLADFVQGMSPPYLSDEYFALVRLAAESARDHGLLCWLYDEGGWPSGSGQGHVLAGHPELARLHLVARRLPEGARHLPPHTVAALGLPEIGIPDPIDPRDLAHSLTPHTDVVAFTLEPDTSFIDVMNPAAVQRFIEVTHERYATAVGDLFGGVVPGIFTDETPLGGRVGTGAVPWTRLLLEQMSEELGRDARPYLPLLFDPAVVGDDLAGRYAERERVAARCAYYECATRLFRDAYWEQITKWCRDHGLIHTGHVGGEDNLPDHLHFGHFFRTAGFLDAPGVDVIWRQLEPGPDNFPFPRFPASAHRTRPRAPEQPLANLTLTESNAVYGYGFEYGQMRWLADYQFQCGVNLYAPMAVYYTTEGGRLYGTMSHFGPGMPLWPAYRGFADYVGRQCALSRHTVEPVEIAVYYPVETLWADDEAARVSWKSLRGICGLLQESQRPFDFLAADTLCTANAADGGLQLPQATYRVIIVPCLLTMPTEALTRLADLAELGATVVFADCLPAIPAKMSAGDGFEAASQRLEAGGGLVLSLSQLAKRVDDLLPRLGPLRLTDPTPELLLSSRMCGDGWVCMATNCSDRVLEPVFAVQSPEPGVLEAWDLRDGEAVPLLTVGAESRDFRPVLPPWGTEVFVVRPGGEDLVRAPDSEAATALARWLATPAPDRPDAVPGADVVAFLDRADQIRVREQSAVVAGGLQLIAGDPDSALNESPLLLGPWDEWAELRDFSGRVDYVFEFTLAAELVGRPLLLDLGEVLWAATVELNGQSLPPSLWPPHALDVSEQVRPGANLLTVTVSNTLASAVCTPSTVAEAEAQGWCNAYWRRTQPMMQDRRSGLLGPVRLLLLRSDRD
mgnify:CR=1 FL=1